MVTALSTPTAWRAGMAVLATCAAACALAIPSTAGAATPGHTDVMFVFDTSGSMTSALEEAKSEIQQVMSNIGASLPNVEFGLAEVRDYGGSEYDGEVGEEPWRLDVPLTSYAPAVSDAISGLSPAGGGDGPEAYGRALWETDTNPAVGWRPEASHVVVLVADNVPHDNNLNEGIPEADWLAPSPWNTGEELAGGWGISDSAWSPGDNMDFQAVLAQLKRDGKPLETVDYHDTGINYLPYWEQWAATSGGQAIEANTGELAGRLTTLAREGARLAPNNEFVTIYSKDLPRVFHLATPIPGLLQIPFGAELVPSLSFSARVQPTDPQPTYDESNGASFLTFGPFSFDALDLEWHSAGAPATAGLFAGASIGFEAQLGILGSPTIDNGGGKPLETAFSVPVASVETTLGPISFPSIDIVTPQAKLSGGLDLDVKLYITQAITYAGEKLAEGAVAALSDIATDGVDTPVVVEALSALQAAELADTAAHYAALALKAKTAWNITVNQAIPIAKLLGQLVAAEAPALLPQIAAYLAKKLKQAVAWVSKGVAHVVSVVYQGGAWVIQAGGKVVSGAGHVVSKGWHFVTGLFGAYRPLASAATFQAAPSNALALKALKSSRRLGFGPKPLTRGAARAAARALVKYGFDNATLRPLLVSRLSPRSGRPLCVAGARLTTAGTAVVELSGPGYRSETLMRTRSGTGGACLRLPKKMAAGKWTIGIVDYNAHAKRQGVLVDAFPFAIHARHAGGDHRVKHR
jgi:von Willebrand factor type A domain-containing protein